MQTKGMKTWDGGNPKGWVMSEKMDGVRAIWDGVVLRTREGNVVPAPASFTESLPARPLDGELWMGRGTFQAMLSLMKQKAGDWSGVRYMVFDEVEQVVCTGARHLETYADALVAAGAEGVVLRRGDEVRKHKPVFTDEATVVGHDAGKGRNAGRVGALVCEYRGLRFSLGSGMTDDDRIAPPAPGAVVTFSYQGLTGAGIPRNAAFLCVRDYE